MYVPFYARFMLPGSRWSFTHFYRFQPQPGSGLKRVSESCCCRRRVLASLSGCQALFTGSELLSLVVRLILTVKPVIEAEATTAERRAQEPRVFTSSLSGPKCVQMFVVGDIFGICALLQK